MSSILTGAGGRTYGFDFVKSSPSPAAIRASHTSSSSSSSSSPSSTISESSNSPLAISTRKPRTPRKRPNQTYNEAAALLSTVYPNLFSNENLKQPGRSTGRADVNFLDESAEELFLPFRVFDNSSSSFLLQQQEIQNKPSFPMEPKVVANLQEKQCQSPGEIISRVNSLELDDDCGGEDDFDAESILDEEIDEGIDSVIGSRVEAELEEDANGGGHEGRSNNYWSVDSAGFGFGGNFDFRLGLVRALRPVYEGNWWNFPAVDIVEISPRINKHATTSFTTAEKKEKEKDKKTKKKKTTTTTTKKKNVGELPPRGDSIPKLNKASGMMLKLNYDGVLNAWSDRGSPFAGGAGNDVVTIEEFLLEKGEKRFREASVLRYREKRRTRLLSKKIRYQVRKFNADQRPRIKGRFVMRPNTCSKTQRG